MILICTSTVPSCIYNLDQKCTRASGLLQSKQCTRASALVHCLDCKRPFALCIFGLSCKCTLASVLVLVKETFNLKLYLHFYKLLFLSPLAISKVNRAFIMSCKTTEWPTSFKGLNSKVCLV